MALRTALLPIALAGALTFAFSGSARATQSLGFQTIYQFSGFEGKAKGQGEPTSPLVSDGHGGFYGAGAGGPYGDGDVFRLNPPTASNPKWTELTLHVFGSGYDGFRPNGLAVGHDGDLYGTTPYGGYVGNSTCSNGGCGVVYRLKHPAERGGHWTEEVLHAFTAGSDGAYPMSAVLPGPDGAFYGTTPTSQGAAPGGTVYAIYPPGDSRGGPGAGWHLVTLYNFSDPNEVAGYDPEAGLIGDSAGNLYGATYQGPGNGYGTIFKLAAAAKPPWSLQVLHAFSRTDTGFMSNALTAGPGGSLYGAASGTVFRLTPPSQPGDTWPEDVLGYFKYGVESGVITDASGALYGTAYSSAGLIAYKLTPSNGKIWSETALHQFPPTEGNLPGLIEDASQTLYGTTTLGGRANAGTVFKLTQ